VRRALIETAPREPGYRDRMRSILLAAAACAAACGSGHGTPAPPPVSTAIAFVDVTVVPMDAERLVWGSTVVVDGGTIVAFGPTATTPVPAGATRIDGAGRYLLPGLVDCHVHLQDDDMLSLFVANGVTTVRNLWGRVDDLGRRDAVARGQLVGPRIFTAGAILDGAFPTWPTSVAVTSPDQARREVAAQKADGYDYVKVYTGLGKDEYAAIVAAAADHGMPVIGHVPRAVGVAGALAAGQRSIEHLDGYGWALRAPDAAPPERSLAGYFDTMATIDEAKLPELVAETAAAGTWNCATMVVLRDAMTPPSRRPELLARPEVRFVPPSVLAWWNPANDFRFRTATDEHYAQHGAAMRAAGKILARLHAGGARIAIGTDTPNPNVVPGFAVHEELALFVAAGLSPYEALRAATRDPAELLGVLDEQGTIDVGKRADLVLVTADPLADVGAAARRAGVMVAGRWYPEDDLHERLEAIAASYRSPPPRFDGAPAADGVARFELWWDARAFAEERLAAGPAGLSGRIWGDPPDRERIDYRIDATSVDESMHTGHGEVRVTLRLDGETARLAGDRFGRPVAAEAAAPPGAVVACSSYVGQTAVVAAAVAELAVDARTTVVVAAIDQDRAAIEVASFEVVRTADDAGARRYRFTRVVAAAKASGSFAVAADGALRDVTWQLGFAQVAARRL
jgi:imidazolonepropionase-like amidohydrolase